jgi:hypothetical protein
MMRPTGWKRPIPVGRYWCSALALLRNCGVDTGTVWKSAPDHAEWRRIDHDWLASAGQLALDLNSYTNNTSLVLAFELGPRGKVLLFAADAQRGN